MHLGYGLTSKRRTDPALTPAQLPSFDALVLSHLHGDHFDRVARRELPRGPPVVTTERAAGTLRKWGFAAAGLDHWSVVGAPSAATSACGSPPCPGSTGRWACTACCRRSSAPSSTWRNGRRRLARALRVYITGDTLTCRGCGEVAERFPDVDVMVTHLGGTQGARPCS